VRLTERQEQETWSFDAVRKALDKAREKNPVLKHEIQVYLKQRKMRLLAGADYFPSGSCPNMDFDIYPDMLSGNDQDDAQYAAKHVIEAAKINGLIKDGDVVAIVAVPETTPV